ncbi:MAG: FAD-binding oxidoreductase [Bacteroidetes bacterium]|nr:FAD-binding oxidoreductase [Bacteroidota bacterium]MBS1942011.1 FAD-binding oxidoreductase [Bacteroidota bacterium]
MEVDVLILGRGIAGAVLAECCRIRGLSFHLIDHKLPGNATMAAGGAVNPMVLRRDTPCWRAETFMPSARSFFQGVDARRGTANWKDCSLVKIFGSPQDARQWEQALAKPETAPFMASRPEPEIDRGPFRAPHGYGTVVQAGRLDIPALLAMQREELLKDGALTEGEVQPHEVQSGPGWIGVGTVKAKWLVRCTGPFLEGPGLSLVKGETLTVRIPGLRLSGMVHGAIGLLPAGNGLFRVGSTFKWTNVWEGPTAEARTWMLARLAEMVDAPMECIEAHAGVRPAARDRKPILGIIGNREAVLNGLGARGVMQAPWCAAHLLEHLIDGKPLDPEVDCGRFA